ncbi:hypothetical protein KIL84_005238 [Mauremys mutica]|uniref:Uncharacterized protein n=1 Tax=Mauremys mutica TaxID=74926 RepID=A0A9D4AYR5_9SAUR|nr:hypothetical protein KIL84_005238 [Mauremys mutica]
MTNKIPAALRHCQTPSWGAEFISERVTSGLRGPGRVTAFEGKAVFSCPSLPHSQTYLTLQLWGCRCMRSLRAHAYAPPTRQVSGAGQLASGCCTGWTENNQA